MPDFKFPSLLDRHWSESALAIGAVLIAAVSLWVAVSTVRTNQKLVAAASWPFIRTDSSNALTTPSGRPLLTLDAINSGIGPAKIESVQVFWRGKAYRDAAGLLRACCGLKRPAGVVTSTLADTVVREGQTVRLIAYAEPVKNSGPWLTLSGLLNGKRPFPQYRICYCSAFNECWITNGHQLNPPRVSACPTPKISFAN